MNLIIAECSCRCPPFSRITINKSTQHPARWCNVCRGKITLQLFKSKLTFGMRFFPLSFSLALWMKCHLGLFTSSVLIFRINLFLPTNSFSVVFGIQHSISIGPDVGDCDGRFRYWRSSFFPDLQIGDWYIGRLRWVGAGLGTYQSSGKSLFSYARQTRGQALARLEPEQIDWYPPQQPLSLCLDSGSNMNLSTQSQPGTGKLMIKRGPEWRKRKHTIIPTASTSFLYMHCLYQGLCTEH